LIFPCAIDVQMSPDYKPTISIIIPALNEGASIGRTLTAVSQLTIPAEVIVVDGWSDDDTRKIARGYGARVVSSERGRSVQMHRGARVALGEVFWFLHADTVVPANAADLIQRALIDNGVTAGNFDVHFDGSSTATRFMTWLYPQLRRLGLCYGDSAIFVRREAYQESGGFDSLPIFEDLDLLRRLRRKGRFVHLPAKVVTSARRFRGRSFVITFIRWIALQLPLNPRRLGRLYTPVREPANGFKTMLARIDPPAAHVPTKDDQ
jgi:rSAM/selenodomain-associated transferase 2